MWLLGQALIDIRVNVDRKNLVFVAGKICKNYREIR